MGYLTTKCCNFDYFGENHSPIRNDGYCMHCGFHPKIVASTTLNESNERVVSDQVELIKNLKKLLAEKDKQLKEAIEWIKENGHESYYYSEEAPNGECREKHCCACKFLEKFK